MSHDNKQRDSESRQLEALMAISIAIGKLGPSLTAFVRHDLEKRRRLDRMDQKLDLLLKLANAPADAA